MTPVILNCAHEEMGQVLLNWSDRIMVRRGEDSTMAPLEYCTACGVVLMPRKEEEKNETARSWAGPYFVAAILALFLTSSALAQAVEICPSTSTRCVPPPTWKSPGSKPPLDAPVRFGGEEIRQGEKYWRWIRNGDPSRPCTAAETASPVTAPECKAKIGDLLFVNQRFRPKE